MKLYIKNIVCDRCKMVVRSELQRLKIAAGLDLGELDVADGTSAALVSEFGTAIAHYS